MINVTLSCKAQNIKAYFRLFYVVFVASKTMQIQYLFLVVGWWDVTVTKISLRVARNTNQDPTDKIGGNNRVAFLISKPDRFIFEMFHINHLNFIVSLKY